MRKQTKIAAVASAAALLAIGASMTAFADWQNEDGTWYYYDKDGNRVEDEWKSSNGNWYWLDSEEGGAMATAMLVEDDDDTYYVDETGAMVRNQWISIVNEDQDDDDDPAEYNWYYFQSSGKAYKGNGSSLSKKTIDGKRYAFDEDGKMLYGWVNGDNGDREGDDDAWKTCDYYFGDWNDGSMKTGWQKINVHDDGSETGKTEDDYDYWFNFKSNGKKRAETDTDKDWKSNGKYYHFNAQGVMVSEWYEATDSETTTANWRYFNSPEDGARVTKGWFKVIPANEDNTFAEIDNEDSFAVGDANDESERWYYADGDGVLAEGEIRSIKGKYYGFAPSGYNNAGRMLTGLCILQMDPDDMSKIDRVIEANIDSDDLDNILDNKYDDNGWTQEGDDENIYLYYFGNDEDHDGAMKTGNVTLSLDGESYTFFFKKSGSVASGKGAGVTGIDDEKYVYKYGCRIKADSDDKYQLVKIETEGNATPAATVEGNVSVTKEDVGTLDEHFYNKDSERVSFKDVRGAGMYLVNTSGTLQKNKSGLKGDDIYFYVGKEKDVWFITDNKTLRMDADNTTKDLGNLKEKVVGNSRDDLATAIDGPEE